MIGFDRSSSSEEGCAEFEAALCESVWSVLTRQSPEVARDFKLKARVIAATQSWVWDRAHDPRPELPSALQKAIEDRNWPGAFALTCSPAASSRPSWRAWHPITAGIEMVLTMPDVEQWPRLLAIFLDKGDNPAKERCRLSTILEFMHSLGLRVFDTSNAQNAFYALPRRVMVYRGSALAEAEAREYGLCWTLDRDVALFFARFQPYRYVDSPAVILKTMIDRTDISGLFCRIGHSEVMICPGKLDAVIVDEELREEPETDPRRWVAKTSSATSEVTT